MGQKAVDGQVSCRYRVRAPAPASMAWLAPLAGLVLRHDGVIASCLGAVMPAAISSAGPLWTP